MANLTFEHSQSGVFLVVPDELPGLASTLNSTEYSKA